VAYLPTCLRRCPLYRLRRIQSEAPSSLALAIHVDFGKSSLAPQAEPGKRLRKVKLLRLSLSRMSIDGVSHQKSSILRC
jgi:hypothetical protein